MKKLFVAALAMGTMTACINPPTSITLNPSGGGDAGGDPGTTSDTTPTTTDTPTETDSPAKAMYKNTVHPKIATCAACHASGGSGAPIFMANEAEASYASLDAYSPALIVAPANSQLLLHGPHTGPGLTPDQQSAIEDWLLLEVEERGLENPDPGDPTQLTLDQALAEFGACMDIAIWEATGMNKLPEQQTAGEGPCLGCHSNGEGGTWLSLNVDETFAKHQKFPYIKRLVTGTVDEQTGAFKDLIPANRYIEKGSTPCADNDPTCHPMYILTPTNQDAVTSFVQQTLDKWHNGGCTP